MSFMPEPVAEWKRLNFNATWAILMMAIVAGINERQLHQNSVNAVSETWCVVNRIKAHFAHAQMMEREMTWRVKKQVRSGASTPRTWCLESSRVGHANYQMASVMVAALGKALSEAISDQAKDDHKTLDSSWFHISAHNVYYVKSNLNVTNQ